jgi:hypothetical protein
VKKVRDPIAIRHSSAPGEFTIVARRTLPAWLKRGWVEAKSPGAKAAVEQASPGGDTATPSTKEDRK